MLGFQTDWDIEFLVFDWTQIGVVLGLGLIAKQRSGFGFNYMLFALMRGNNPRRTYSSRQRPLKFIARAHPLLAGYRL